VGLGLAEKELDVDLAAGCQMPVNPGHIFPA
jgi:hypothetical protein